MRGRRVLMESFVSHGVRHIFGNPGTTETPLLDSLPAFPQLEYIMGGVGAHQQCVAVGRAAGDLLGADAAERAGAVLDQHGLAERVLQMLADQPRDIVGTGAGRERHDDLERPLREIVGRESRQDRKRRKQDDEQPQP